MEFTSSQLLAKDPTQPNFWLCREILSSCGPAIANAPHNEAGDHVFDVKLVINGIELDPKVLQDLLQNIEKHIDDEARSIAMKQINQHMVDMDYVNEVMRDAIDKIKERCEIGLTEDINSSND